MNLLDVLDGNDWSIQQAIQTTFPFDPQFYSSYIRPRLQQRNCDLPLVLVDGTRYDREITSSDWREAPIGTDYLLEPVDPTGVFHPKINLFASERSVYVSVTSANLTLEEYCKAAQIGYATGFQESTLADAPDEVGDTYFLATSVRDFYTELLEHDGLVTGQDARTYITETAETLAWLDDVADTPARDAGKQTTWFLSNLSEPILQQALDRLGRRGQTITRAKLYAPYYGTPNVLKRVSEQIDPDRLDLLVEPESTALDVAGLPDALGEFDYEIRRMEARTATRWVHAKFLLLEGPWGTACLYGSPNMTSSALLDTAVNGNIEAALLTLATDDSAAVLEDALFDADAYEFEVSDPISDLETLDLRATSYEGWEAMDRSDRAEIALADARLTQPGSDDTSELILTIAGIEGTHDITVRTDTGVQRTVETTLDADDQELSVYLSEGVRADWAGAVVTVEINGTTSNPRRVVEEMQAYYREFREMTRSSGTQSSNTLLREILENPDTVAVNVFDIAMSELRQRRQQTGDSDTRRTAADDEEVYPERSAPNLTTGGRSRQSLPSLVQQHLAYHQERAVTALDLDDQPQPDDPQQFIDHARTFWETIELCFALDQFGQLDTDQINTDRLFTYCERQLDDWFDHIGMVTQRLNGLIDQIASNRAVQDAFIGESERDVSELTVWRSTCEILFLHPGVVLEFDHTSAYTVYQSKNGLANRLVSVFKDVHPHIGQHILDGEMLTKDVETLLTNLAVELETEAATIDLDGTGIQALLLYLLVQRIASSDSFLEGLTTHERFAGPHLSELAEFVLEADEVMVDYGLVTSLQWSFTLADQREEIEALR